ncbi:MAG: hypothetical protein KDA71_17295, partial [Planctomycetales bacterium]|nr:hypothetical protein [Planctomycetales bacterium]
ATNDATPGTVPRDRTSPDLASPDSASLERSELGADATPAATTPTPPPNPAAFDRFRDYRSLVSKFARDIAALRKLRDLINEMIDELLAANATK